MIAAHEWRNGRRVRGLGMRAYDVTILRDSPTGAATVAAAVARYGCRVSDWVGVADVISYRVWIPAGSVRRFRAAVQPFDMRRAPEARVWGQP